MVKARSVKVKPSIDANAELDVEKFFVNPSYISFDGEGNGFFSGYDVAVVILKDQLGTGKYEQVRVPTGSEDYMATRTLGPANYGMHLYGYGPFGGALSDRTNLGKVRMWGGTDLVGAGGTLSDMAEYFDGWPKQYTCAGDSGGGVFLGPEGEFDDQGDKSWANQSGTGATAPLQQNPVLIGLISMSNNVSGKCGEFAKFARIDKNLPWIAGVLKAYPK